MWGRVLDVTIHAKFQLDRFRGFGAPGGRKSLSPIDWRYRPDNSVRALTCYTVISSEKYLQFLFKKKQYVYNISAARYRTATNSGKNTVRLREINM